MFESCGAPHGGGVTLGHLPSGPDVDAATLRGWMHRLGEMSRELADVERVDRLRALEDLKAAASAAQARLAADLDASVREAHRRQGLPAEQQGRGVAAQVAIARRESPNRGGRHLGLAKALVHEMPHTMAALRTGLLSEWRATLLARETACLSREDRARADEEIAGDPERLDGMGDRALVADAKRVAYRLDPGAALARVRRAEHERRVTIRPAPDTMTILGALLPVKEGVAAYAALTRAADEARAAGDGRTRGQVMADTLVARVTGRAVAADIPVTVNLVMTDRALFLGDHEPATIPGYGPVPAAHVRDLLRPRRSEPAGGDTSPTSAAASAGGPPAADTSAADDAAVFLRRLFTHPSTGELVAMESSSRHFPDSLRDLLVVRDQTCRTPWCDAPVRHADHAVPHVRGGATDNDNGQGLCEACNYVKEAPGWRAGPAPGGSLGRHLIETVTPTGHRQASRPPPLPGGAAQPVGRMDVAFLNRLHAIDGPLHAA